MSSKKRKLQIIIIVTKGNKRPTEKIANCLFLIVLKRMWRFHKFSIIFAVLFADSNGTIHLSIWKVKEIFIAL